jgi:hypothetical protein
VVEVRGSALEHGSTRPGRWLRERRTRIALLIAVVEGILVVLDVIPGWVALTAAAVVIVLYLAWGRRLGSDSARQLAWIAALSQSLVALIPLLLFVLTALAVLALAVIAVFALIALFTDRR